MNNRYMKKRPLFNPDVKDNYGLITGETTNIFNINGSRYRWASNIYKVMMSNFWIPENVDLSNDITTWNELSEEEKNAFRDILSFLVFLDSIQTTNIPNIAIYIKAPEVVVDLSIHTYQEAIHAQSYSYIIETVIPPEERDSIYYRWRDNPMLLKRNNYITYLYQKFLDEPTLENYADVLIANFILESLYFYNGFIFFYNLSSRGLMQGTSDIIKYINKDEYTHIVLFKFLINELTDREEGFGRYLTKDRVYKLFREAVKQELEFSLETIGDKIPGMSRDTIEDYTYYLANKRLKILGLEPIFPDRKNPYKHLERIADVDGGNSKVNFFEATVTSYNQPNVIEDWDEI